jgi:hypothetical protein
MASGIQSSDAARAQCNDLTLDMEIQFIVSIRFTFSYLSTQIVRLLSGAAEKVKHTSTAVTPAVAFKPLFTKL